LSRFVMFEVGSLERLVNKPLFIDKPVIFNGGYIQSALLFAVVGGFTKP
jgi:hypothetical protein